MPFFSSEGGGDDRGLARIHRAADVAGIVVLFVDHAAGGVDFAELAEEAEFGAVLIRLPTPAVFAARTRIHLAHRHRPAGRAEHPAFDELGLGVRLPDQRARAALKSRVTRTSVSLGRETWALLMSACMACPFWNGLMSR